MYVRETSLFSDSISNQVRNSQASMLIAVPGLNIPTIRLPLSIRSQWSLFPLEQTCHFSEILFPTSNTKLILFPSLSQ